MGQFAEITGVAVDSQGNVYVTDVSGDGTDRVAAHRWQLQKFTASGAHAATTSVIGWGSPLTGPAHLRTRRRPNASDPADVLTVNRYDSTLALSATYPRPPPSAAWLSDSTRPAPLVSGVAVDRLAGSSWSAATSITG